MTTSTYNWNHDPSILSQYGDRQTARGSDGTIWVAFGALYGVGDYRAFCLVIPPGYAGSFIEVVSVALTSPPTAMAICTDLNDEPIITLLVSYARVTVTYRRESGTWTAKPNWSAAANGGNTVGIVCRSTGEIFSVVADYSAPTEIFRYKRSITDLASWVAGAPIIRGEGNSSYDCMSYRRCSIALDQSDDVHIVYSIQDAASSDFELCHKLWDGAALSSQTVIETLVRAPDNYHRELQLAVDVDGNLHLVFVRQSSTGSPGNLAVWYCTDTGGSWSTPEQVSPASPYNQAMPTITVNGDGGIVIHWVGQTSTSAADSLMMAEGSAGSWSTTELKAFAHDVANPQAIHTEAPLFSGWPVSGWLVSWYERDPLFGQGGGRFTLEDDTTWHCYPTPSVSLGLSVSATVGGVDIPRTAALPFIFMSVSASETRETESAAAIPIGISVEAAWKDHGRVEMSLGFAASAIGELLREGTVGLSLSVVANRQQPLLCETEYEPSPAVQSDPDTVTHISLHGPYESPTTSIQLPRPRFGDGRELDPQVVVRRSRHGEIRAFTRTPTYRNLTMEFEGLQTAKLLELEAFLEAVRGYSVRLVDWESRSWRARITDSETELVEEQRSYGGSVSITMDVEPA